MRGTVLYKRANSSCFAVDQGFWAAKRNFSKAVFISTNQAGKGLEKNRVLATCRCCILWVPVPDHWWGLQGVAGDGPEPQGHTEPVWCAENRRGSVLWPPGVQGVGSMSALLVGRKTSGNNAPMSLHRVCLVCLSLSGQTSSYSLSCKHRGFVLDCYRLPLLWWCQAFFSHPMSKRSGEQFLTVPSGWDWDLPLPTRLFRFSTCICCTAEHLQLYWLSSHLGFLLVCCRIQSLLLFFTPKPITPSWRLAVTSCGHQVLTPAVSALAKPVPVPLLGATNPPSPPGFWGSAGIPHEFSRTLSSPALWSSAGPYTHSSHPAIPVKVFSMNRASSESYVDTKICWGVLSRGISAILCTHGRQQSNSCKQMLPAVTWMGLVREKLHILDEHQAFLKNE